MLVILLGYLLVGLIVQIQSENICPFITEIPTHEHIETLASFQGSELFIDFAFPIYEERKMNTSTQRTTLVEYQNALDGEIDLVENPSPCSFIAHYFFPEAFPMESVEGSEHLRVTYFTNETNHKIPFFYDYSVESGFNLLPIGNSVELAICQIIDFYIEDVGSYGRYFHWTLETRSVESLTVDRLSLISHRKVNFTLREEQKFVKDHFHEIFYTLLDISIFYQDNEEFSIETLFLDLSGSKHSFDLVRVNTGFIGETEVKSENEMEEVQSFTENKGFVSAFQVMNLKREGIPGETNHTIVSMSNRDEIRISIVLMANEKFVDEVDNPIINIKSFVEDGGIKLICLTCDEKTVRTYNFECSSISSDSRGEEYYDCIHHEFPVDFLRNNITLNLRGKNVPNGVYDVFSDISVLVTFENGQDRFVRINTFSQVVVSTFIHHLEYYEIIIITFLATLGIMGAGGSFGIGLFIMRVLRRHGDKRKFYHQFGGKMYYDKKTGKSVPLLDLTYNLRHKDIMFSEEELDGLNRSFDEIFKLQKASKYTPYVHCKFCFLEQKENRKYIGDVCCKCGLPLLEYVSFDIVNDGFCAVCSMMNKYQPRPHGRCLIHLSNTVINVNRNKPKNQRIIVPPPPPNTLPLPNTTIKPPPPEKIKKENGFKFIPPPPPSIMNPIERKDEKGNYIFPSFPLPNPSHILKNQNNSIVNMFLKIPNNVKKSRRSKRESRTSKKNRSQGSVYVLFRDQFSIGSISRQIKKKQKNSKSGWISTVTNPSVWKLNALMRFEYLTLIGDLIHHELVYVQKLTRKEIEGKIELVRCVREKIMKKIGELEQKNLKSPFLKRLKIKFTDSSLFEESQISSFYKKFKSTLVKLVPILDRQIYYLEEKKNETFNVMKDSILRKRKRNGGLYGNGSNNNFFYNEYNNNSEDEDNSNVRNKKLKISDLEFKQVGMNHMGEYELKTKNSFGREEFGENDDLISETTSDGARLSPNFSEIKKEEFELNLNNHKYSPSEIYPAKIKNIELSFDEDEEFIDLNRGMDFQDYPNVLQNGQNEIREIFPKFGEEQLPPIQEDDLDNLMKNFNEHEIQMVDEGQIHNTILNLNSQNSQNSNRSNDVDISDNDLHFSSGGSDHFENFLDDGSDELFKNLDVEEYISNITAIDNNNGIDFNDL